MKINKKIFIIVYILFFTTYCHSTAEVFIKEKRENGLIICSDRCYHKYIKYNIDYYSSKVLFKVDEKEIFIENIDDASYETGTYIELELSSLKPTGLYRYTTSEGRHKVIPCFRYK